jgi:hypothetical protein
MNGREFHPAFASPAHTLQRLVEENALSAAEQLLKDLDSEALDHCIEEMRVLMSDHGFELPDWDRLSEDELRQLAAGAFYVENGKPVLTLDG